MIVSFIIHIIMYVLLRSMIFLLLVCFSILAENLKFKGFICL